MADGVAHLSPADYWELRARQRDVEVAEADLLRAQITGRKAIEAAKVRAAATFDRIADAHGLDLETVYAWNDEDCTLRT